MSTRNEAKPPGVMVRRKSRSAALRKQMKENQVSSSNFRRRLKSTKSIQEWFQKVGEGINSYVNKTIFCDIPAFYPLKKKIMIYKQTSLFFMGFDMLVIVGSFLLCLNYVCETYDSSYLAQQYYAWSELIFTIVFIFDFFLGWYLFQGTNTAFFMKSYTIVDILTIVPVLIAWGERSGGGTGFFMVFRFLRILRLLNILKAFKEIYGFDELNRQILELSLTILSLVFIAAGLMEMLENRVKQYLFYNCQWSTAATNWEPSCYENYPYSDDQNCDCVSADDEYTCESVYNRFDKDGQPSEVRCNQYNFFTCIYYVLVTITTVGYGDISPSHFMSKLAICFILLVTAVLIPVQFSRLSDLLSLKSPFRKSFSPAPHSKHVMVCGYVNNRNKLENFYREMFNEGRCSHFGPEFVVLVLGTDDPSEDVVAFLLSKTVDGRMVYRIGDPNSSDDMHRVSADKAMAVFYLCDPSLTRYQAMLADMEVVIDTLAVETINPDIETLAQVILHDNRDLLHDTDIDVVLTFQDYKATLMGRSALCPGFATLIEGLMTSSTVLATKTASKTTRKFDQWEIEYLASCDKELYVFKIDMRILQKFFYRWPLVVEAIYIHYGLIVIGVVEDDTEAVDDEGNYMNQLPKAGSLVLNPTMVEIQEEADGDAERFFNRFNHGIVIGDTQISANILESCGDDEVFMNTIVSVMSGLDEEFPVGITSEAIVADDLDVEEDDSGDRAVRWADGGDGMNYSALTNTSKPDELNKRDLLRRRDEKNMKAIDCRGLSCTRFTRDVSTRDYLLDIPQLDDARDFQGHIVIIGADHELAMVLKELRRPVISGSQLRPVIIFSPDSPASYAKCCFREHVRNVYWIQGRATEEHIDIRLGLYDAFSITMFSANFFQRSGADDHLGANENEADHADLALLYLHLQHMVPSSVFLSAYFVNPKRLSLLNLKAMQYSYLHRMSKDERVLHNEKLADEIDERSFILRKDGFEVCHMVDERAKKSRSNKDLATQIKVLMIKYLISLIFIL